MPRLPIYYWSGPRNARLSQLGRPFGEQNRRIRSNQSGTSSLQNAAVRYIGISRYTSRSNSNAFWELSQSESEHSSANSATRYDQPTLKSILCVDQLRLLLTQSEGDPFQAMCCINIYLYVYTWNRDSVGTKSDSVKEGQLIDDSFFHGDHKI